MGLAQDIQDQFDEGEGRQTLTFEGSTHNQFTNTIIPYVVGFAANTFDGQQEYGVVDLEYVDKQITVAPIDEDA